MSKKRPARWEKALNDLWALRDKEYLAAYRKHTKATVIFAHKKIPVQKLLDVLIPAHSGLDCFQDLTAREQTRLEATFIEHQLKVWDDERTERKKAEKEAKKQTGWDLSGWEVYRDVADYDRTVAIWHLEDGHREAVVGVDSRNIIEAKQAELEGQYDLILASFDYHPWKKFGGKKVIARHWDDKTKKWIKQELPRINPFQKAEWYKLGILPEEDAVIPPLFAKFFDHFFVDEVSKQATFAWLYRMVFGEGKAPNQAALVLNGAKAIGKNAFSFICKGLVGPTNFKVGKRSIMSSDFNLDLKECLCYFLDEINIRSKSELNKFKAYCNQELELEGKGLEAKTFDTFKSFLINNNDTDDIAVSWDDRRFSVPDLTRRILKKGMGKDLAKFWDQIADFEGGHYRQFGSWLYHNADLEAFPNDYAHKGERFGQMVLANLTSWQAQLRKELLAYYKEALTDENELFKTKGYRVEDLRGTLKAEEWPQDAATFQTFLDNYLEGERRLGVLKIVEDPQDQSLEPTIFHPDVDEEAALMELL